MTVDRRGFIRLAGATAALPILPHTVSAQAYPSRPARIVVGYAAGGGTDITARVIAQWLSERLGQQFVVENRPGASTNIATEFVVRSAPDGYTLFLSTAANSINTSYFDKLSFDFVKDMAPVGAIMRVPLVLVVNPSLPVKNVKELIEHCKANPKKLNFGSGGAGGPDHMAGEYFKLATGADVQHVAYRGLSPALTDLIGGQIQMVFSTTSAAVQHIKGGKLKPLAVTSPARSEALPDVPTMAETLRGFEANQWYGLNAPRGTPPEIIAALNKEVLAAQADEKLKVKLAELGGEPMRMTPSEFGKFIAEDTERWAKVIKFAGVKPT